MATLGYTLGISPASAAGMFSAAQQAAADQQTLDNSRMMRTGANLIDVRNATMAATGQGGAAVAPISFVDKVRRNWKPLVAVGAGVALLWWMAKR